MNFSICRLCRNILYIGETKSQKAKQLWEGMCDSHHTIFIIKYIIFILQIIKWTFILLQTFRTYVSVNLSGFAAVMT